VAGAEPLAASPLSRCVKGQVVRISLIAVVGLLSVGTTSVDAAEPLHQQIDAIINRSLDGPVAERSSDAEFLRRAWLDLAGVIPTAAEARDFLADDSADKRQKLIDRLLASDDYPQRMQYAFTVMLLERRTGATVPMPDWDEYLRASFAANKPLDQLVRELVSADGTDSATRPAMKFLLARSATDHRLLARDVSRLLLGRNLECAQCHDHPTIKGYHQSEFFGIVAFLNRSYLYKDKKTNESFFVEKGTGEPIEFTSVFTSKSSQSGPRLPGGAPLDVPVFEPGEELAKAAEEGQPPLPKFPLRPRLAEQLTGPENRDFSRNLANRLWALMMGRGLVHPLDMRHEKNPPSHPELLDVLGKELVASGFDTRHFLREIALSETWQRSTRLGDQADSTRPESYAVANLRALSAEQVALSMMQATGSLKRVLATPADLEATKKYRPDKGRPIPAPNLDNVLKLFRSVYAGQPGEPEDDFNPSLAAALFVANETLLLDWLSPGDGNLLDRLMKCADDDVAAELYLSVLSRDASEEERLAVTGYLTDNPDGRETALREMAWALLGTSEFRLNH
jgi:hypothetical protein